MATAVTLRGVLHALFRHRLRRAWLLIGACLALFAGVFVARVVYIPVEMSWLLAAGLLVGVGWRRHGIVCLAAVVLLFFGVGLSRGNTYVQKLLVHESFHYQKVTLVGKATDEAVYGKRYQLEFVMSHVRVVSPQPTLLIGNVTVRGFGEAAIYRGDTVQVTGKFYPTLGNSMASVSYADLRVIARGDSPIDAWRRSFGAGMQSALPEPAASFALGLVIGQRTTLPEQTEKELREVGLTHIVAVSGYNLTVIVMACRRALASRSKYQATVTCLVLIGIFLLITGFTPPIVRASIVSLLGIGVWYYGRQINAHVLLLLSAAVTVVANPVYLWGNVSWYLSFLAFYGVLVLAPVVTRRIYGPKEPGLLSAVFIESLCASLLVLPYLLFIFGEVSTVGLLANVLVVPLIPLAMLLAAIAGFAGMWVPIMVAGWFSWPATLLLTYMLDVAALLSRAPNAFIEGISVSVLGLVVMYATIELVVLVLWHKTSSMRRKISES